jgi:hypothetical protein
MYVLTISDFIFSAIGEAGILRPLPGGREVCLHAAMPDTHTAEILATFKRNVTLTNATLPVRSEQDIEAYQKQKEREARRMRRSRKRGEAGGARRSARTAY